MRLIDADSLKCRRKDYGGYDDVGDERRKRGIFFLLEEDIAAAQTIDPFRHGMGISIPHKKARICSVCGCDEPYKCADEDADVFNYCLFCGVRIKENKNK